MSDKQYRIHAMQIENFKKIVAVEIKPDGSLIELTGANRAGKSSILDAIWVALEGKAVAPAEPIRAGAEKATIKLDLGELVVTRTFRHKGEDGYTQTITVEDAHGNRLSTPETLLKSLFGELTFDPLEFEKAKPADQFEILKRFVRDFDFDEDAKARQRDFDARTDVNRRAKELRAQALGIVVDFGATEDLVDETALLDTIQGAAKINEDIATRARKRKGFLDDLEQLVADTANMRAEAEALRKKADELDAAAANNDVEIDERQKRWDRLQPLPKPVDIDAARKDLDEAQRRNAMAAKVKQRREIEERAIAEEQQALALTKAIEARDEARKAAIKAAALPIAGLELGDDMVRLNGVPFAQASDAERLQASVAIAMAMNPKLRIIRIREGSRLDSKAMQLVAEMADARGYQVFVETVESSRPTAILIEDGRVARGAAHAAEAAE